MKVTAEELRARYAALPEDELLALDPDELMNVARQCYEAELKRRGLQRGPLIQPTKGEPAQVPAGEPVDLGEPLAAATFLEHTSAAMARQLLRQSEIPSYVENEHLAATGLPGELRLMVPALYLERARQLLAEFTWNEEAAAELEPWDGSLQHQFAEVNGIRMHYVEAGTGPLVVLCHGFPESWYSWRHQLPALAAEGYHVVAPDLRGYGQTDRPADLEAYDVFQLTGDIVGLVNAWGGDPAVIIGHDWGAWIACHAALLRPDLFRAVALLSVPFVPRRNMSQTQWEAQKYPGKVFYQAVLRSPMADQFLQANIRSTLLSALWTASGDAPPEHRWKPVQEPGALMAPPALPSALPKWLTEADLDFLEGEFKRTGFTGPLNYYRNLDRNWALTPFLDGAKLLQCTVFAAGENDAVLEFLGDEYAELETNVPNLWKKVLIPGAGHWLQQECPAGVNDLLIRFLQDIEAGSRA